MDGWSLVQHNFLSNFLEELLLLEFAERVSRGSNLVNG